ncbi:hypothetical protein LZ31DRAFT_206328 [Colletotrichum somersetense]|nr:hypothetical protein LZ31DRAFT_206328 [Colletotrichum somersetense]
MWMMMIATMMTIPAGLLLRHKESPAPACVYRPATYSVPYLRLQQQNCLHGLALALAFFAWLNPAVSLAETFHTANYGVRSSATPPRHPNPPTLPPPQKLTGGSVPARGPPHLAPLAKRREWLVLLPRCRRWIIHEGAASMYPFLSPGNLTRERLDRYYLVTCSSVRLYTAV